ncbi:MAG: ROK family protein [Deltaproteobacteria bacterium]|jgi:glucokinase|nr:ROK family protein [Deltaproteobacteria bacterium]
MSRKRPNKDRKDDDSFLAVDIGGTNVTCGLVSRRGQVLSTDIFPTSHGPTPKALIELMVSRLDALRKKADASSPPAALAVGAPGWLRPKDGIVVKAPNIKDWIDIPIAKLMAEAMGLPVRLENDANLYALGEWLAGSGQGSDNEIVLTLGTGVGAGLILKGQLWSGYFFSAGEVGHIPLGPAFTTPCGCGGSGCLETVASAKGMSSAAREWLKAEKSSLFTGSLAELNTEVMRELAEKGDPMSLHVFRQAGLALGQVLAGVFNLLSIERAVIGGGAAGAFEFIKGPMMEVLSKHIVTAKIEEVQIVKGALGSVAPLIGGAAHLTAEGF